MVNKPTSPLGTWRALRDQLGSLRGVYGASNRIVRRDDFANFDETVLLLHGFFQTRNVWEVMEDRLRFDGFGVFSFDLGGLLGLNTHRPQDLAERVADKLERLCMRTGLRSFHIVGHSKGGLIAREYVQHLGGARRVKSVVTLGTPHHGTPTAAIGVALISEWWVRWYSCSTQACVARFKASSVRPESPSSMAISRPSMRPQKDSCLAF